MHRAFTRIAAVTASWSCMAALACSSTSAPATDPNAVAQRSAASQCGGFTDSFPYDTPNRADEGGDQCGPETLAWFLDVRTGQLTVAHRRVVLNCCGDRRAALEKVADGEYVLTERDTPTPAAGRCHCFCIFDFALQADSMPTMPFTLTVKLEVSDDASSSRTVWTGTIDPADGSAEFKIPDAPKLGGCET